MAAFHSAHRPELRRIIADLDLPAGARVLDVACGDGAYSRWLAEEVGSQGVVTGIDVSQAYLGIAQGRALPSRQFAAAQAESLPFPDNTFDLAWCAQSMMSLEQPAVVLQHILRVIRPGGRLALLENDSLHEMILPWPESLEIAIRTAEYQANQAASRPTQPRYLGRRLAALMHAAGLESIGRKTYATDRIGRPSGAELSFLAHHLDTLRQQVWPFLTAEAKADALRLLDAASEDYLLGRADFEMTWLDIVCVGRKPVSSGP